MDWQEFFNTNGSKLILFSKQWVGTIEEAEELVQDATVRLWKKLEQGTLTDDNILAMMYKTIRWMALDRIRRKKRHHISEEDVATVVYNDSFFEEGDVATARRKLLESVIKDLPQNQREVLVMKVWQGMTFQEIADVMEISINTVAARYRYALIAMKKKLGNRGVEDYGL